VAIVFALFMVYRAYSASQEHAKALIDQQAHLAMQFNLAIRGYAGREIRPVMEGFMGKDGFKPETMSTSYISRSIFEEVCKHFPGYIIRFASDNPRNPVNAATPDELRIIDFFRKNKFVPQQTGMVDINGRRYWAQYVPRWIKEECLRCHGDPKDAPADLLKQYGSKASFHRTVGDLAGLDTIAIPMDATDAMLSVEMKKQSFISIAGIVLVCMAILGLFRLMVTKRLAVMAAHFQDLTEQPESQSLTPITVRGKDEISVLGHAFNRLLEQIRGSQQSLEKRVQERTADLEHANETLQNEIENRRQAEEAAIASEKKYRELVEHARSIILRLDIHGNILFINEFAQEFFQFTEEEILGRNVVGTIVPEKELSGRDLRVLLADICQHPERYGTNENENIRKNGERVWIAWTNKGIPGASGQNNEVLCIGNDITELKRAEEALRASETRLLNLFQAAPIGLSIVEGRKNGMANNRLFELVGYSAEEAEGQTPRMFYESDEEYERVGHILYDNLAEHGQAFVETKLRHKNGTIRNVLISASFLEPNVPTSPVIIAIQDITEKKRAEATLQTLLQAAPIGITIVENRVFQYVNEQYCRMTGYTVNELIGHTTRMLYDSEEEYERAGNALYSQLSNQELSSAETYHIRKDGSRLDILLSASFLRPDTDTTVVTVLDLTQHRRAEEERQRLETQFHQAQKMEAVGQLAGGVAHDFNNILQVINGYTDIALMDLEPDSAPAQALQEIATAGERAARLVGQLLAFSRRQIMRMEYMSLNIVIEEFLKMMKRMIGEDIQVEFIPGHALGVVHVDRGQMEQVLMNLCVNARDAMPQGGTLTIETKNVELDRDYCFTHAGAKPGHYVMLSITDTGIGMDEETVKHIFEPFFTTKGSGKGTGLGLATVYGIVNQHDGMIQVYSEPGMGTIFKIYLPKLEPSEHTITLASEEPVLGGAETILMAEDDEMVRNLAKKVLENAGYTVLIARDGQEALQQFRDNAARVDLVLLDVVMPNLGGKAVYDELRKDYPDVRFLFSSGYSENAIHTGFILDEGIDLIQKPYAPKELLRRLRVILDKPLENEDV